MTMTGKRYLGGLLALLAGCGQALEVPASDPPNEGAERPQSGDLATSVEAASGTCAPQRAAGVGVCRGSVGVFWTGVACTPAWGCSCEGADCAQAYETLEACERAYTRCEVSCAAQDAHGVGACRGSVGAFWNGAECTYQWGCSCEGADCARAFETIEACEEAHQACSGASPTCPTEKLAFTKQTGCENDGSVEFCIPNDDASVLSAIRDIASSVRCAPGGGRARCASMSELLCSYPTESYATEAHTCQVPQGELTDSAWAELCQIAALPQVRQIVPTWYE
jgi:hypothetical protein